MQWIDLIKPLRSKARLAYGGILTDSRFLSVYIGAFANAIINLLLAGKVSFGNFWIWAVIGAIIALLLFWLWQNSMRHREIMYGYRVAIRTYDGNYVKSDLNRDHQLFGREKHVKHGKSLK